MLVEMVEITGLLAGRDKCAHAHACTHAHQRRRRLPGGGACGGPSGSSSMNLVSAPDHGRHLRGLLLTRTSCFTGDGAVAGGTSVASSAATGLSRCGSRTSISGRVLVAGGIGRAGTEKRLGRVTGAGRI